MSDVHVVEELKIYQHLNGCKCILLYGKGYIVAFSKLYSWLHTLMFKFANHLSLI